MNSDTFLSEFESFRSQLESFVLRMTASVQDTEDIVQETFIKASSKIDGFRGESSIKTWVFAIASNLARDLLRAKKRWPENVTDICREAALGDRAFFEESLHIRQTSPQGHFEIKEHIAFCFTCVGKSLPLEQQITLLLKEVYGFKLKEIGRIMEQSEGMVKYHLHHGRSKMIEIFDRRCSLINQNGICHQCSELNGIYNPKQVAQEEIIKIKMAREADLHTKEVLFELRTKILRDLDPFHSAAAELQLHHLEHNRQVMEEHLKD